MTSKKILWFMDWEGSAQEFNKVSKNADFNWETASTWAGAKETFQSAWENGAPFAVAFVDSFEKAEQIWAIDPSVQCVIWADTNWTWDWQQNWEAFGKCNKWFILKNPASPWEAWQAANTMWRKWEAEKASYSQWAEPSQTRKILVVDDETRVRSMVVEMLTQAGFECVTASDGEEALSFFDDPSFKVDLLLTDIVMPRVTGTKLAEAFNQRHPSTPVVFMSGFPRNSQFQQDVENGEKLFLQKPFAKDALFGTIQSAFQNNYAAAN